MAVAVAGGGVAAPTIINYIACMVSIGLRFIQLRICFCFQFNGAGDIAFQGFVLMNKSVNCLKLFISAYRQVHNEGVGLFALSCLFGLSLHLCAILIHLYNNHTRRAIGWISRMEIFLATGACMLAMRIPREYDWHSTAVEVILDLFICLEALLLVLNKMSENGGIENLLQDLIMISVETLTNCWLFANYIGKTHSRRDADKILHLVGSCMSLLIALGQIGWIAHKAYTHGVFLHGEKSRPPELSWTTVMSSNSRSKKGAGKLHQFSKRKQSWLPMETAKDDGANVPVLDVIDACRLQTCSQIECCCLTTI